MKRNIKIISLIVLTFSLIAIILNLPIFTSNSWSKIGEGNLKSIVIDGETFLVTEREDFSNFTGERNFGFRMIAGKKPNGESFIDEKVEQKNITFNLYNGTKEIKSLSIKNTIVSSEVEIKLAKDNSKVFYNLGSDGLWVSNADGSNLTNIGLRGLDEIIQKTSNEGIFLNWINQPYWVGNSKIVFMSNRDVYPDQWYSSIWIMDSDGTNVRKIIDAVQNKEELNLLYADEKMVIAYAGIKDSIYKYYFDTEQLTIYEVNGSPVSVSNNGKYILYNEIGEDFTVKSDIMILNTNTDAINKVEYPKGYQVFNGAWSQNNQYYAFYSESIGEPITKLFLLDVNNLTLQEIDKPFYVKEKMNSSGSISWLNDDNLIISLIDSTSWKVYIGKQ